MSIANNGVKFDNWIVLQTLNLNYHVKTYGRIDIFREVKIVKISKGILNMKFSRDLLNKAHNLSVSFVAIII